MKKTLAAFLIYAQSLASPAFAGPSPEEANAPAEDVPVLFTGAVNEVWEGLIMTDSNRIKKLAAYLKQNMGAETCTLTGHTSWPGPAAASPFQMQLSAARIEVVIKALREQGVDTSRLSKEPRGGLDYATIANGDADQNRSVILECPAAISLRTPAGQALG